MASIGTTGKGKFRRVIHSLVSNTARLVTVDNRKAEVFSNFFCLSLHWQQL